MNICYPLLPQFLTGEMFEDVLSFRNDYSEIRRHISLEELEDKVSWPASGGKRVDWDVFSAIRSAFDELLYKRVIGSDMTPQDFDHKVYRILKNNLPDLTPSLAAKMEFWNFMNVGLLPDVVVFRWGRENKEINKERFFSKRRNYLGTLWWRVDMFFDDAAIDDAGKWKVLDTLSEDEFVQIMERPRLAGYQGLALALGREVADIRQNCKVPASLMKDLVRNALVELRIQAVSIDFNLIADYGQETLREYIKKIFQHYIAELSNIRR